MKRVGLIRTGLLVALSWAPILLRGQIQGPANGSARAMDRIPFVGCASDGQMGPKAAPHGTAPKLRSSAAVARQLAYYKAAEGFGVLAPRGWHCFGVYGSDGETLYVSPEPIDRTKVLTSDWSGLAGPAIEARYELGGTSGRFGVAQVIARVFPAHKSFVEGVVAEGIEPASSFPAGPYPGDRLTYENAETVEYETPARTDGLGTDSRLARGELPIRGVDMLLGKTPDLMHLAVRLPPALIDLAQTITAQAEREGHAAFGRK